MKNKIVILVTCLTAMTASSRILPPFPGWDHLEQRSADIMLVSCGNPTQPALNTGFLDATRSDSQVEVLLVLKGTNNPTAVRLLTDHELQPRQAYLVFGNFENAIYNAWDDYDVVPVSNKITLDSLKNKTLDQQLKILFQFSVEYMNQKIAADNAERDRLEQALQK